MDIKIYRYSWNDISTIQEFLHKHLLKYKIVEVDERLFVRTAKQLPVVEVGDKFLFNPSAEDLHEAIGFKNFPLVDFHDFLVVGTTLECGFVLDYAMKKGVDVRMVGDIDEKKSLKLKSSNEKILKLPNLDFIDYIESEKVTSVELMHNRIYLKVTTDNKVFYTRSVFVSLEQEKAIGMKGEEYLYNESIFFDKESLLRKIKTKRPSNARTRRIALIGNDPEILEIAYNLSKELERYKEVMNYEIIILSECSFLYTSKFLLRELRVKKHIKVYGRIDLRYVERNGYQLKLYTNLLDYDVDFMLVCNKQRYMNKLLDEVPEVLDDYGSISVDMNYKSKYPSIYAMPTIDGPREVTKLDLLDRYMECAKVVTSVKDFLARW